jgi:glycosyltransferase involved in cell wall biosynthesis
MKLGLFADAPSRSQREGGRERVWTNDELLGFGTFAAAVGTRLDGLVLIARRVDDDAAAPYELPAGVELAELPFYGSLRDIVPMLRALPATVRALWRAIGRVDAVWVSAGNPIGVLVMALAALRRRRILVLVRQDTMSYFRSRLPSPLWRPVLVPLRLLDWIYRAVGRRAATVVVGAEIAKRYGAPRANVLETTVSLASEKDIPARPRDTDWPAPVRLLTVGRVEPEKNPLLLVDVLARLERERPGRFVATWAGTGRLLEPMRAHAEQLGVSGSLELPGFVPVGERLQERYREADAFVHISWTEGVPGVIGEAFACGLPTIATDVGGVRDAVEDGKAAVLVPPGDAAALVESILALDDDPALRRRLGEAGLRMARGRTLEIEADRVAEFIAGS